MQLKSLDKIVIAAIAVIFIIWGIARCSRKGGDETTTAETPAATNASGPVKPVDVFISTDSLKMRTGPSTDSAVVVVLRRNEVVTLTGEKSNFSQTIKLDNIPYNEPWLKAKARGNKTGWIFGGGVRPYRK